MAMRKRARHKTDRQRQSEWRYQSRDEGLTARNVTRILKGADRKPWVPMSPEERRIAYLKKRHAKVKTERRFGVTLQEKDMNRMRQFSDTTNE